MQASDFMNEESIEELCRHVAHWIFGSHASLLPRPGQASEQAASQDCGALSEDRIQVRCFLHSGSCCATPYRLLSVFPVFGVLRNGTWAHPRDVNVDVMFM